MGWRNRPDIDGSYGVQLLIKLDHPAVSLPNLPDEVVFAYYAHLKRESIINKISSAPKDSNNDTLITPVRVQKGEMIAKTGKTGNAKDIFYGFEEHLHFELRVDNSNATAPGNNDAPTIWGPAPSGLFNRIDPSELFFAPPLSRPVIDPI